MRDSAIIYRSFYEAIKELPKPNQAEVWEAIFEYSLNFNEIELKGISKTIFTLIKPQLEANIKKFLNGTKPKQKGSKTEASEKPEESKTEGNVNDNVNDNDNDNNNENENIPVYSDFEIYALKQKPNVDTKLVKLKYDSWVVNGWKDGKENAIKNWKAKLNNTLPYIAEKQSNPTKKRVIS